MSSFHTTLYRPLSGEVRAETNLEAGTEAETREEFCLQTYPLPFLHNPGHLPRRGTAHNGPGLLILTSNQESASQTWPQASLMKTVPHLRFLLPRFVKLTAGTSCDSISHLIRCPSWTELCSPKRSLEILTPETVNMDFIWKWVLCRDNQVKMRPHSITVDPNTVAGVIQWRDLNIHGGETAEGRCTCKGNTVWRQSQLLAEECKNLLTFLRSQKKLRETRALP